MADYIKREDVFEYLEIAAEKICLDDLDVGFLKSDFEMIPAADVRENVRGEWIADEDGNIKCSVCEGWGVGGSFCENCGANMRKE